MLLLLQRLQRLLRPFKCQFAVSLPRPKYTPRPPPDLPLEIWLEIFEFATYVHRSATISPLDPFALKRVSRDVMGFNTPSLSIRTKLSLVLVCRSWRQIATRILYKHLVIRSPARAAVILNVLLQSSRDSAVVGGGTAIASSGYGQWTRHIEIYTHARGSASIQYLQTLFRIFQCCPNIHMFTGAWNHDLPIEFLSGVARLYGPVLRGLYWGEKFHVTPFKYTTVNIDFLSSFTSLFILDLRNFVGADFTKCPATTPNAFTLPYVRDLIISTSHRSLDAATRLSLPALRNVTLSTGLHSGSIPEELIIAFLKVHGSRITAIDLPPPASDTEPHLGTSSLRRTVDHIKPDLFLVTDLCPNLTTFSYPATSPLPDSHTHKSLRHIGLRGVRADGLYPDKKTSTKNHLMAISTERYPNLELVKTIGFLVEADTDALIKDIFIWWTERFEKQGVDFLDGEGVLWAYTDPVGEDTPKTDNLVQVDASKESEDVHKEKMVD